MSSKLLTALITGIATLLLILLGVLIILRLGLPSDAFNQIFKTIGDFIKEGISVTKGWFFVYIFEVILLAVFSLLFNCLFAYCCLTIGAVITKKAKVVVGIGIYYVANMIFSFIVQMFLTFVVSGIAQRLSNLNLDNGPPVFALAVFIIVVFFGIITAGLYLLEYYLLDRKLNLA